ncbi:DUF2975 domain-containing protein [Planktotalea sp.]|uniref:DUF2975 domain-containing protein n=1 Tax=Planktotalea sp. TaxID=2029877 RepID=UPI00329A5F45
MHRFVRVKKWSHILEWVTSVSLIAIPIVTAISLFAGPITPAALDIRLEHLTVSPAATSLQLYTALGLLLIPMIISLFTLNAMRNLFRSYRKGDVLTENCAVLIQRIGQGFLALSLAPFFLQPVLSVLLSMANPAGERLLSVNIDNEMIFFAVAGGLIVVIGWAMREASDLEDENRAFI